MKHQYLTTSPAQTKKTGENLAKGILKHPSKRQTLIIGLVGELGSGKTTFLQGFAKGLGIKQNITSPTFAIIRKYEARSAKKRRRRSSDFQTQPYGESLASLGPAYFRLYHIDCYRIQRPKEMFQIGFREILAEPAIVVAIEWADRIQKIMPRNTNWIKFEFIDKKIRKITIKNQKSLDAKRTPRRVATKI